MASETHVRIEHDNLYLAGRWREAATGTRFSVEDPATGQSVALVASAVAADGRQAVQVAAEAQADWAATPLRHRAELLRRAFDLMLEDKEALASLITLESGKPLAEARAEVDYAAEFFRWYSEVTAHVEGGYRERPGGGGRIVVMRRPVGPSLLITPWNFPAAMVTRKVAPALAAGCTCILKPAEQTPLTALRLAWLLERAGLPAGVLNVVPTDDPGPLVAAMMDSGELRKLSFTGSTEVGRFLLGQAAGRVLRTSMELGGNAPFVVFDDADVDQAVDGLMVAKLRNAGQSCVGANRIFVQRGIAREFLERLTARFEGSRVGPGVQDGVDVGPLIERDAVSRVAAIVSALRSSGAEIVSGGDHADGAGYFFTPTIACGDRVDEVLGDQEIFGPLAPISVFDEEQEAVARANDTDYGLVAYLYTNDLSRSIRVSEALETGMVGLNTGLVSDPGAPFGGVKQSGLGREGGAEGIHEFLETRYLALGLAL